MECRASERGGRRPIMLAIVVVGMLAAVMLTSCRERVEPVVEPTYTPTSTPQPTETATATPTVTPTPTVTLTPSPKPTPDPYLSPLTGQRVDDLSLVQRRIVAVRVGNDPNIRPQDGLGLADVVFEEIMDGWSVTRFLALYQESSPERVRPLRSARLSSLYLIPQYDAAHVHTGASDPVRWRISQADFIDLDEFFHPQPYRLLAGYDWRGRMYTSVELVHEYLEQRGLQRTEPIRGYTFSPEVPEGEPALVIDIPYPSSSTVRWVYEEDSGRYLRYVQGRPHIENLTQEQIAAENVIVFYAEHRRTNIVEDALGATAIDIVLSGEGRAQLCRDGVVQEVIWRERAPGELIEYFDEEGERVPLKPGRTWIQVVPLDYEVVIE